ncbi:hypothetical protein E2320_011175, partial [Naja naja]
LHGYLESEPLTLQLFIGTADDRLLRPHAFYQVHRITGKTVSTTSHETILSNTKELPLVEKQSTDSYHVMGGKKIILSGHNFLQDSKVIFVEKAP